MKLDSRKTRVFVSSSSGVLFSLVSIFLSLGLRTVFVNKIGISYVGLYSFLTGIFGILTAVDGGACSTLFIKIHKPIAENNVEEMQAAFKLIKIVYFFRAIMVLLIGILLFIILPMITPESTMSKQYIRLVYLVYLIFNSLSYLLIYYQFLLEAFQKRYLTNVISFIVTIISTLLNIVCIILFQNFLIYVVIISLAQIFTYLICAIFVKIQHPRLFENKNIPLIDLRKKIIDMFQITYYTLSSVIVKNTDNILVTKILGFSTNGIYSTYKMLNAHIFSIVGKIKYSVQDSARNYIIISDNKSIMRMIDNLSFFYFWISGFCIISLTILSSPFITFWLGENYTMDIIPVFLTTMTLFGETLISPMDDTFYSTGLYTVNKIIPIIETLINLIFSIILGISLGITGIMLGTLFYLIFKTIIRSSILFSQYFNTSSKRYLKKIFSYIVTTIIAFSTTYYASSFFDSQTKSSFVIKATFCLIIPNTIFVSFFSRSSEFKYFTHFFRSIIKKNN